MICVVDVPTTFNGTDSLKFVKCKNFLDSNPSYHLTIARSTNSVDNTPNDFYAVMNQTYQSCPIVNDPAFFTKLTISNIPRSLLANYEKNMTPDQINNVAKENWTKASNIYCKHQPDYNSCMKTLMGSDINKKNTIKPNYDFTSNSKNNFGIVIFIIFFICILSLIIFLLYKNKFY